MNYFPLVSFSKNLKHENIFVYLHDFYFSYLVGFVLVTWVFFLIV